MKFAETYSDKTALKLCAIQSIPKTCLRYHTQVDPPPQVEKIYNEHQNMKKNNVLTDNYYISIFCLYQLRT